MAHVFVSPHPDDVALSCGGLVAGLRALGQEITIVTVFSGTGAAARLTPYQRDALGFGPTAHGPAPDETAEVAAANEVMARRRAEEERYAESVGAALTCLDLPDAVFRGYGSDEELFGRPRPDDAAPFDALRREIARLEPERLYLPLGIGGHVDHQLVREFGLQLLGEASWTMAGSDRPGRIAFYEDFPYAWREGFCGLDDLPPGALANLPARISLTPESADITDQLQRKLAGITRYESQLDRQFGSERAMADAVRAYARATAEHATGGWWAASERTDVERTADGVAADSAAAERYWVPTPI